MKILILKPSSLGDVVQAMPVLRMLKRHWPQAEIHWWIEKGSAALLEGDPDLAGTFVFDRQRWGRLQHCGDIWRCIRDMRRQQFDLVLDLQALARSATIAWLANGARIVGLQDWRELAPGYYDISIPRPSEQTHAVDWYLEAVKAVGAPLRWDFEWLPKRTGVADQVAAKWNLHEAARPLVVLQPGARWENKRWPAEHYAEMVQRLRKERPELRFAVVGGKSDHELGYAICRSAPDGCTDLTGRTSLPELVEVIRSARLMVTNDSGPMHIAAALAVPVVGLFGPTNPRRTGPYGQVHEALQRKDLPCIPCMRATCRWPEPVACLRGIRPEIVAATALKRLSA